MRFHQQAIVSSLVLIGFAVGRADAAALDPTLAVFTAQSQGDISLAAGSYEFVLGTNGPSLISLNGPVFTTIANGFVYNGINVFDFHSLNIAAGANITTIQSSPSGPIALLSSTSINMGGSINLVADPFNNGGPGAANTGVGGMGGGYKDPLNPGPSGFFPAGGGGGGFGGRGQSAPDVRIQFGPPNFQVGLAPGGAGGAVYESLADRLQGGSRGGFGGGPAAGLVNTGAPGFGGGAIELGAVSTVAISGSISANGSSGFNGGISGEQATGAGGGGSGGGVFLHGNTVIVSGTINALGGAGGSDVFSGASGGAGSGGLVLAQYGDSNVGGSFLDSGTVNVGTGLYAGRFDAQVVPEPSSLILLGISALGGVVATSLRRRRR